tara:strand:+ start:1792 stop:2157 length:366 start_codon:yes stop_codon:yes gene_type:complete
MVVNQAINLIKSAPSHIRERATSLYIGLGMLQAGVGNVVAEETANTAKEVVNNGYTSNFFTPLMLGIGTLGILMNGMSGHKKIRRIRAENPEYQPNISPIANYTVAIILGSCTAFSIYNKL